MVLYGDGSGRAICFRCHGKGYIVEIDWFFAVLSIGLTALVDMGDHIRCPVCKGSGILQWSRDE